MNNNFEFTNKRNHALFERMTKEVTGKSTSILQEKTGDTIMDMRWGTGKPTNTKEAALKEAYSNFRKELTSSIKSWKALGITWLPMTLVDVDVIEAILKCFIAELVLGYKESKYLKHQFTPSKIKSGAAAKATSGAAGEWGKDVALGSRLVGHGITDAAKKAGKSVKSYMKDVADQYRYLFRESNLTEEQLQEIALIHHLLLEAGPHAPTAVGAGSGAMANTIAGLTAQLEAQAAREGVVLTIQAGQQGLISKTLAGLATAASTPAGGMQILTTLTGFAKGTGYLVGASIFTSIIGALLLTFRKEAGETLKDVSSKTIEGLADGAKYFAKKFNWTKDDAAAAAQEGPAAAAPGGSKKCPGNCNCVEHGKAAALGDCEKNPATEKWQRMVQGPDGQARWEDAE